MRATGTEVVTEAAGFKLAVGQLVPPWNHSMPGPTLRGSYYPYLIDKEINRERINNLSKVIQQINSNSRL